MKFCKDTLHLFGRDPLKDREAFFAWRTQEVTRLNQELVSRIRSLPKPLDVELTVIDNELDPAQGAAVGSDVHALARVASSAGASLQVEDPYTTWTLGPTRYITLGPKVTPLMPAGSAFFDLNIVVNIFGLTTGTILFTLALALVRSVMWAVLVGLVVESLETGQATVEGARRGLRAAPAVLGIVLTNVAVIFMSQILRFVLGASIGSLAFFGGLVGGLYFLGFAPVIAVREGVPARQAMGISARAASLPGARHLGMVFLYFSASFFAFLPAGRAFSANPSLTLWVLVLAGTIAHMVFLAGFAHRYLVVKDEIPPPTPRQARTRRRLF